MYLSPGQSWLTGAALSGLILTGSVIGPAHSQSTIIYPATKPVITASENVPTKVTQLLNQQFPSTLDKTNDKSINEQAQRETVDGVPKNAVQQRAQQSTYMVSRGTRDTSSIVDHALSLLGLPYVWGGTTRKGFDCSGFTKYVFAGSGIALPRTSYEQFTSGTAVKKNDLLQGDLVFFSTDGPGASHVGIYIGDGRFVQASNPHSGVKISSLSDRFYSSRYLGARRY